MPWLTDARKVHLTAINRSVSTHHLGREAQDKNLRGRIPEAGGKRRKYQGRAGHWSAIGSDSPYKGRPGGGPGVPPPTMLPVQISLLTYFIQI